MPEYPENVTCTDHYESHAFEDSDTVSKTYEEEEKGMAEMAEYAADQKRAEIEDKPIDLMMKEAAELHEFAETVAQQAMERVVRIVGPCGELSSPVEKEGPKEEDDSLLFELRETYLKGIGNSLTKIQMAINSL